ncbi:MAG: pseudoazurin [Pseudomonadota bacterium]
MMIDKGRTLFLAGNLMVLAACGGGDPASTTEEAAAADATPAVTEAAEETVETAAETVEVVEEAASTEVEDAAAAVEEVVEASQDEAEAVIEDATEAVVETVEATAQDVETAVTEVATTGKVIEVGMYTNNPENRRETMVFTPNLLQVNVGDTVKWVATEPSHQSASIPGMIPEGAEAWYSQINKDVEYTFTIPGVYGYQCVPHYAGGMVGLIIVEGEGKLDNLESAKAVRHPGLAQRRFPDIFAAAEEAGYLSE